MRLRGGAQKAGGQSGGAPSRPRGQSAEGARPDGSLGFGTRILVGWEGSEKGALSVGVELSPAPGQWDVGR